MSKNVSVLSAPQSVSRPYAYFALVVLCLLYCVNYGHRQVMSMFLEAIRHDLLLSDTQTGIISGLAFSLIYSAMSLPVAQLADRQSRPIILSACIMIWSTCLALTSLVQGFAYLMLARLGVGIGEAGFGPAANSLLGSYFPATHLARAAAVFGASSSLGIFLAYGVGGWLLSSVGWRMGLVIAGLPGILLGIVALGALREPRRRSLEIVGASQHAPSLSTVLRALASKPALLLLIAGAVLGGYCDSSIFVWFPTFMMRSHRAVPAHLGWILGITIGLGQMFGILLGGILADILSKRDIRWSAWLPAVSCLAAAPIAAIAYMTASAHLASVLITAPILLSCIYWAPMIVCLQLAAPPNMRTVFIAVAYMAINGLGYGIGPLAIGAISDVLSPRYGSDSLRHAMLSTLPVYLAASAAFLLAAQSLRRTLMASSTDRIGDITAP